MEVILTVPKNQITYLLTGNFLCLAKYALGRSNSIQNERNRKFKQDCSIIEYRPVTLYYFISTTHLSTEDREISTYQQNSFDASPHPLLHVTEIQNPNETHHNNVKNKSKEQA